MFALQSKYQCLDKLDSSRANFDMKTENKTFRTWVLILRLMKVKSWNQDCNQDFWNVSLDFEIGIQTLKSSSLILRLKLRLLRSQSRYQDWYQNLTHKGDPCDWDSRHSQFLSLMNADECRWMQNIADKCIWMNSQLQISVKVWPYSTKATSTYSFCSSKCLKSTHPAIWLWRPFSSVSCPSVPCTLHSYGPMYHLLSTLRQ